jgi:hypothetical protein
MQSSNRGSRRWGSSAKNPAADRPAGRSRRRNTQRRPTETEASYAELRRKKRGRGWGAAGPSETAFSRSRVMLGLLSVLRWHAARKNPREDE